MLGSVLIVVPFGTGLMLSPLPGMAFLVLLVPAWLLSLHVMIGQNHDVALRLIEAEFDAMSRARTDPLTGLNSRGHFNEFLAGVRRDAALQGSAILCLDLDGFKRVNDNYGHAAGDELLRLVARRLLGAVRDGDSVFRLGGDEFVVLLHSSDRADCDNVARRLISAVSAPYCLADGLQVVIGASVGSASAAGMEQVSGALLKKADAALYRAKSGGRGIHIHATDEMHS
jgi:diguanylate cyclase (GGDEF)-like protein